MYKYAIGERIRVRDDCNLPSLRNRGAVIDSLTVDELMDEAYTIELIDGTSPNILVYEYELESAENGLETMMRIAFGVDLR